MAVDEWFKLHELIDLNPKFIDLSGDSAWLYVRGLAHCSRHATDGFIDRRVIRLISSHIDRDTDDPYLYVGDLVEAGLWHEVDGGWEIHDFHDWNRTSEERRAISEVRREAGRKGGIASGRSRAKQVASEAPKQTQSGEGEATNPEKSRGEKSRGEKNTPSTDVDIVDDAEETFEQFWPVYPERDGKKIGRGKALVEWRKLTMEQRRRAFIGARHLAQSGQRPKDAHRFLRKDTAGEFPFDDWQDPPQPSSNIHLLPRPMQEEAVFNAGLDRWVEQNT